MDAPNLFVLGNNVFILIGSAFDDNGFGDKKLSPKYHRASISGNIFTHQIYTLDEIPSNAMACKSFLEVYNVYYS